MNPKTSMNLIISAWMPVLRQDGKEEMIPPWKITSDYEKNPVIDFHSTRPDFNGALWQFCVGLFQTVSFWEKNDYWLKKDTDLEKIFYAPPDEEKLKKSLEKMSEFFEFENEHGKPVFLQDFNKDLNLAKPRYWLIERLLINSPNEDTFKDLFVKKAQVKGICPPCCALALFNLQNSSPAGGVGHRTSIRGGGPLNTLIKVQPDSENKPATVWENIAVNLMSLDGLKNLTSGDWKLRKPSDIFPWLKITKTSEAEAGGPTRPDDIHPFQLYWGMPRRIRIDMENREAGNCDLCGKPNQALITRFLQKNYGINYDGNYYHPFSPHIESKKGVATPMHPQPGGIGYRHFHGLAVNDHKENITQAKVVSNAKNHPRGKYFSRLKIWSFGYDMDNAKCRDWHEAQMPLFDFGEADEDEFFSNSKTMVSAADVILFTLRHKIAEALYEDGDPRRKELYKKSFWRQIEMEYWKKTEGIFYQYLDQLHRFLADDQQDEIQQILNDWYEYLRKLAWKFFEQSQLGGEFQHNKPQRIIEAGIGLRNIFWSKKFQTKCGVFYEEETETS